MNQNLLDHQLCLEVYKAASSFSKMYADVLKPHGLTFPQYLVLLAIFEQDEILTKDVGEKLNMGIGTLNPIINRLIKNGWLIKQQSDKDKRAYLLSLTDKANEQKETILLAIKNNMQVCGLVTEETLELLNNLKQINHAFEALGYK
ncbi:MarR family winged helix-turn-helix transcriptional regulator [Aquibacillus rhizosphaerae]|uniref:HTH-type transcriptional regulator MgrA n=1 Tax=Aquibacillus rhizosphaerae TaxID=3051431 RepID=A0ABT7LBA9_9BACI|nr:MarR family transcriptional regulator [Aquibacillus sp. LR5S19]MDL4843152.1 MarR family transcriptional regulator [Aquibacillus sp. LR5S19]